MVIKRVCAWCGRDLGSKECPCSSPEGVENPVTHSICPECLEKALAEIESAPTKPTKPNE